MEKFDLSIPRIDENNTAGLFDHLKNIEKLSLTGNLFYFNLDSLVNLKSLTLFGNIHDCFNFELFKNISNKLNHLSIRTGEFESIVNYDIILKLFNGHDFSALTSLDIRRCLMKRLEKKFLEQFPKLQILRMNHCYLNSIEDDTFSNSNIVNLDLSINFITALYKRDFSKLINLKYFNMSSNSLDSIENGIFSNMENLRLIDVTDNCD